MVNLIPKAVSNHPLYPRLVQALRILQFLSALISLILFSVHVSRLITRILRAQGAVLGIVAAGLAYTIIATLISVFGKAGFFATKAILLGLDLLFMIGFIAVAVLTSPSGGAARGGCGATRNYNDKRDSDNESDGSSGRVWPGCALVTGTFALAITST